MISLDKAYRGIVKAFKPAQNKRFGFMDAVVEGKAQLVFFHAAGYRSVGDRDNHVPLFVPGGRGFRDPKPGNELVFLWSLNSKGKPKAYCWAFADAWDKAAERIRVRSSTYRYSEVLMFPGRRADQPEVIWEGTDLGELDDIQPVLKDGALQMIACSGSYETGYLLADLGTHKVFGQFEQRTADGWRAVLDPRRPFARSKERSRT